MAYSGGAPSTFLLKLKIHCKSCERRLKRQLLSVQGVVSVQIDAQQGNVTVSGFVTPSTVISVLETLGRRAELLWQQIPAAAAAAPPPTSDQNMQIVAQSKVVDHLNDPEMVAQLQQLSGNKRLKNVEITYTKTVKLNFHSQNDEESSTKIVEIKSEDDAEYPHRRRQTGDGGGGGGRGLGAAWDSCYGGHRPHHGCCSCDANFYDDTHGGGCPVHGVKCSCNLQYSPQQFGYPEVPPVAWSIGVPSAPPFPAENAPPPPPPFVYSYFSDDYTAGRCNIM